MTLADTACKNAHKHVKASSGKAFKLFDENGLYLLIKPRKNGLWSKGWRFKYRVAGKEKLLSLGVYPDISSSPISFLKQPKILVTRGYFASIFSNIVARE